MAACDGLKHIIDKPLPEISPWKQIQSIKTVVDQPPSHTENIFREYHFQEPSSSSSEISKRDENGSFTSSYTRKKQYKHSDSFSSMNSDNLSICTEGLGFESFDDVEDLEKNEISNYDCQLLKSFTRSRSDNWCESKRSRTCVGEFPPPISCIGKCGKPFVSFKSFRQDGRFILKEMRIPTQELLHACRENGRLKLQFIQSDDEVVDDDDDVLKDDEEENDKDIEKNEDGDIEEIDRNGERDEKKTNQQLQ